MSVVVIAGQLLTYALACLYLTGLAVMLPVWVVLFPKDREERPVRTVTAIIIWPVMITIKAVRWGFTGKWYGGES